METLKAEFARLRGQIELLQNEMENTQKRQRDLYVDLDGRLRKVENAARRRTSAGSLRLLQCLRCDRRPDRRYAARHCCARYRQHAGDCCHRRPLAQRSTGG